MKTNTITTASILTKSSQGSLNSFEIPNLKQISYSNNELDEKILNAINGTLSFKFQEETQNNSGTIGGNNYSNNFSSSNLNSENTSKLISLNNNNSSIYGIPSFDEISTIGTLCNINKTILEENNSINHFNNNGSIVPLTSSHSKLKAKRSSPYTKKNVDIITSLKERLECAQKRISKLEEENEFLRKYTHSTSSPVSSPNSANFEENNNNMIISNNNSNGFSSNFDLILSQQCNSTVVYQRILRPYPTVELLKNPEDNTFEQEGSSYFIEASLTGCLNEDYSHMLTGPKRIIVQPNQKLFTFKKLKILSTSQKQNTLFRLKFTLYKVISGSNQTIELTSTSSNPIEVVSHTQYLKKN